MHSILSRFEEIAGRYPDKTAIADSRRTFTFRQLRDAAVGLAAALPGDMENQPVGVFVNRTAETAVLFLAAVYGGGFYIPLDPDLPVGKLQAILEDARPRCLLGGAENRELLASLSWEGVYLTAADGERDGTPGEHPTSADTPLYMVYTSGSTGKPKGVLKSHGAVLSFHNAYRDRFGFSAEEVIGNQTPFFFDASAKDFYLMVLTGATLEILPTELFSFPVRLVEYMNQRRVTFISWVPTALCIVTQLNTFMEILPETLRRVFFVGEVFPLKQLKKWQAALPELQYVNLYGSSELAGICCYYEVPKDLGEMTALPMGKPLDNCNVFLMQEDRVVTEPGIVGEVYISSPALALAYYHDPEKTARSFVEMTLPDGSVGRVFRSGDLASYDENGDLVFASRKDFQIKHMGRRIELGEIETIADQLPELRRCCCLYNEARKKITLFCELTEGCQWDGQEIKRQLKGHLTDYMMPAKVVILDRLPLNANGKIDRQELKKRL
ncbi:MAG: amino acid adenylation domain-containing protein [Oscillospiraceae bacterium]|nr:amino acid adenylation domain-containing protein [Oscillospiraceae bacterium]